ncbi:SDR family NAD(P)-dependent oxidoreductase [Nocardia sp. NPDC088792]|uniref:SDR family NAD(P)-dependent oxidoreductase n=1 Tax=Nocardia sp. NPDC088792 TaxID=3364332 RepID=UPI0038303B9E
MTGAVRDSSTEPEEAAESSGGRHRADRSVLPVGRFVWRPLEVAPLPEVPSPRLLGRRVAVVGGSGESADRVMAALRAAGAAPSRLLPPHEGGDAAAFYEVAGPIDGIIDLNYERPMSLSDSGGWEAHLLQTIALLQRCYADWRAETGSERLFYVAVTRMDGRHGYSGECVAQPLGGLWAGLAKGLPREFDNVNVRVLDFPAEGAVIEALDAERAAVLCRELYRWGRFEIGYHEGRRFTLVADRQEVPGPTVELGPGDVIVMSGGGRGIGFALARRLCERHRCRVIISGRRPLPDPGDPVIRLSDSGFREYRDRRLIEAARQRTLARTRAELSSEEWSRQLAARLDSARADGLDIVYRQCDVTDPEQVRALLAAAGPGLAGVVHNAGVDAPVRLPAKSSEVVRRTVGVKVTGLVNLLAALAERPAIRFFSTAGSLAGRWGGMVGQLEYGAANDALSRIGLWAAAEREQPGRAVRVPVATMCWPTWERLGIITNYEATLAYMSAMRVEEGLGHWESEILAGGAGEFTFAGEFGKALLPSLLRGYPPATGLAGIERLADRLLFLGIPIRYASGSTLETEIDFTADLAPACGDFRVDGSPAIPLSVLLEFVRSLGDWVQPEGDEQALSAIREVWIDLAAVHVHGLGARLRATAEGRWAEGRWAEDRIWEVGVRVRRGAVPVAAATLRYGKGSETTALPPDYEDEALLDTDRSVRRLQWNGQVFRLGRWSPGERSAEVEADRVRDLVLGVPAPLPELPLNQLETVLRAAYLRQAPESVRHLTIDSIDISGPLSGSAGRVEAGDGTATVYTPAGELRLTAHGILYGKG